MPWSKSRSHVSDKHKPAHCLLLPCHKSNPDPPPGLFSLACFIRQCLQEEKPKNYCTTFALCSINRSACAARSFFCNRYKNSFKSFFWNCYNSFTELLWKIQTIRLLNQCILVFSMVSASLYGNLPSSSDLLWIFWLWSLMPPVYQVPTSIVLLR